MSVEGDLPDPDLPQDPGIPGSKDPELLPPQEEPEVYAVPESEHPDVDDEGHMVPERKQEENEQP